MLICVTCLNLFWKKTENQYMLTYKYMWVHAHSDGVLAREEKMTRETEKEVIISER